MTIPILEMVGVARIVAISTKRVVVLGILLKQSGVHSHLERSCQISS